jgi:hypothetical protein
MGHCFTVVEAYIEQHSCRIIDNLGAANTERSVVAVLAAVVLCYFAVQFYDGKRRFAAWR